MQLPSIHWLMHSPFPSSDWCLQTNSPQFMYWKWCSVERKSLWPVWGSCPGHGPCQLLVTCSLAEQEILRNPWLRVSPATTETSVSYQCCSHTESNNIIEPATREKIDSIPAKTMTENHIISVRCNQEQYCPHTLWWRHGLCILGKEEREGDLGLSFLTKSSTTGYWEGENTA